MKKLFTLTMLLLALAVTDANAQGKKSWDFTKGLDTETVNDLNADTKNWAANGTDGDGVTNNWMNTDSYKPNGTEELMANGHIIKETAGLLINIGNNKKNSIHLAQSKMRLTRNGTTITFPRLANGQKVTVVGRSANGDAGGSGAHRYIEPVQDYIVLVDGTTTNDLCSFVGNNVEGSLGTYSFTWEIQTSEPDSVPVQFRLPSAGIDFTLFMIDEGDVPKVNKVAYLYDGNDDNVLNMLSGRENTELTPVNVTTTALTYDELLGYDLVVVGASVPADNAVVGLLKQTLAFTPMLNFNAEVYAAWNYGEAAEVPAFAVLTTTKNALLEGVEYENVDDMNVVVFSNDEMTKGVKLGDYLADDVKLAINMNEEGTGPETENPYTLIHTHNINRNGYIYIPYVSAFEYPAQVLVENAINLLSDSKRPIIATTEPTITLEYKDANTNIIVNAPSLPKVQVFYTLDGTEPDVTSTLYTGPVNVTEETTFKCVALAEGYTLSAVAEKLVPIKLQPKTPEISYEMEDGKTIVTLSCSSAEAVIFYNFANTTDTLQSTKYVGEPFVIDMPQDVTAFSVTEGMVFSELAQQRILVKNPRVVADLAAHFTATQWTADNNPMGKSVANGKGVFSWGASAASMWLLEGRDSTYVDPETGDETTIKIHDDEDLRPLEVVEEPGENPEWVLKSRGTCLIWQNLTPQTTNFGDNSNYNPIASTDVDPLFPVTKNTIQFYKFATGEPGNGSIETLKQYQAPLDVIVLANMSGGPLLVQVSADGQEWQTIGEIEKTGHTRLWGKSTLSYNGNDQVFVRVTEEEASGGPKVFDIYIANAGEKSQEILAGLNAEYEAWAQGISEVTTSAPRVAAGIYGLSGMRQNGMQRGLNIIVGQDGSVKKVLVK